MKTTKTKRQQRLLLGLAATIGMQAGAYAASAPDVPDQVKVPAGERPCLADYYFYAPAT